MEHYTVVSGDNWYPIARKLAPAGCTDAQISAFAALLAQRNGFTIAVPAPFGVVLHYLATDVPSAPVVEEPPAEEPPATGKPDASNTGPTGPVTRTFGGGKIDQAWLDANNGGSRLLEGVRFTSGIKVEVDDLTIRNFGIDGGTYGVDNGIFSGSPTAGLVLEDGELTGSASAALLVSNCTARRLHIHTQGIDAIKPFRNVLIEDCYLHHIGYTDGGHADGVQMVSGGDVTIRGCNFDMPADTEGYNHSQVVILSTNNGSISNVVIDGNWINGGVYSINVNDKGKGHGDPSGVVVSNNRFGRDALYGLLNISSPVSLVGNVWDDTGEPI